MDFHLTFLFAWQYPLQVEHLVCPWTFSPPLAVPMTISHSSSKTLINHRGRQENEQSTRTPIACSKGRQHQGGRGIKTVLMNAAIQSLKQTIHDSHQGQVPNPISHYFIFENWHNIPTHLDVPLALPSGSRAHGPVGVCWWHRACNASCLSPDSSTSWEVSYYKHVTSEFSGTPHNSMTFFYFRIDGPYLRRVSVFTVASGSKSPYTIQKNSL